MAGWVQENGQYESFGSDKDIVSVSKDSNRGFIQIKFNAPTNFLPVILRIRRAIYRTNGVRRKYDVNNLFPQDSLYNSSCIWAQDGRFGQNDGNGSLQHNIVLSRKLFQLMDLK